jgi:hypothetical protein
MIDYISFFIDNIQEISGFIVMLFAFVLTSIMCTKEEAQNTKTKLLGVIFVFCLTLFANDRSLYILGLIIIGTIVTGNDFMLGLVKWLKTTRTETNNETITHVNVDNKPLIPEKKI